jgi:hypothetical protein
VSRRLLSGYGRVLCSAKRWDELRGSLSLYLRPAVA